MDEYIKKNVLYEKIAQLEEFSRDRYLETPSDSPYRSRYMAELVERTYFKHIIEDFPAADVEPVRHGRWISVPHKLARVCSVCNRDEPPKFADIDAEVYDYCPNCGARMDERNE